MSQTFKLFWSGLRGRNPDLPADERFLGIALLFVCALNVSAGIGMIVRGML